MNSWIAGQARQAAAVIAALHLRGEREVFLHFRRGQIVASPHRILCGFERVTGLTAPLHQSEPALIDWAARELGKVPCCP